jgi:hypothetical protein
MSEIPIEEINAILQKISKDIAKVQHNSDILSQWPIPSIEAMYYSGPFFVPLFVKKLSDLKNNPEELFKNNIMPGKLSNLIFYLLNEKGKEMMGEENHKRVITMIIQKIASFKNKVYFEDYTSETWIPKEFIKLSGKNSVDTRKIVFLLDNLCEMINPIFRTFGMQLFFDKQNVYRYYYNLDIGFSVLIISDKKGMKIDFFEHIIHPEDLSFSYVYTIHNGNIKEKNTLELIQELSKKIESLRKNTFDREYVIKRLYENFGFLVPDNQLKFLKTEFPSPIKEFYIKTCKLPEEVLAKGVNKVLGGKDDN